MTDDDGGWGCFLLCSPKNKITYFFSLINLVPLRHSVTHRR